MDQLKKIIHNCKYSIIEMEEPKEGTVMVMMQNFKVAIYLLKNKHIEVSLFLTDKINFEKLNAWNMKTSWAYAYSFDGGNCLDMHLWIGEGVTEATIKTYLDIFNITILDYQKIFN